MRAHSPPPPLTLPCIGRNYQFHNNAFTGTIPDYNYNPSLYNLNCLDEYTVTRQPFCQAYVSAATLATMTELYAATAGHQWVNAFNWLTGDPCANSWFGLSCTVGGSPNREVMYVAGQNVLHPVACC